MKKNVETLALLKADLNFWRYLVTSNEVSQPSLSALMVCMCGWCFSKQMDFVFLTACINKNHALKSEVNEIFVTTSAKKGGYVFTYVCVCVDSLFAMVIPTDSQE